MNFPYKFSPAAMAAVVEILAESEEQFGADAQFRYAMLIETGTADIAANPNRPGSRERPELGRGIRCWHLRLSRERARTATGIVKHPRHLLFYRIERGVVVIGRVLHEKQDPKRHFPK